MNDAGGRKKPVGLISRNLFGILRSHEFSSGQKANLRLRQHRRRSSL